uniref:Serine hydrolase FSH domain-containing protein n=1 Tax=Parascaris univalens TaxID=6257 RepID=A0A915BC66_PARUN
MTTAPRKLRILCLHGYRQNDTIFREKTGSFRKALKKYADFVFMNAPHVPVIPDRPCSDGGGEVRKAGEERTDPRGWWFSKPEHHFSSHDITDLDIGFEDSVKAVTNFAAKEGPFDGIFAFSQGAALAFLLAALRQRNKIAIEFKFLILVAAFPSLSSKHAELIRTHITGVPCLHIYGKGDKLVGWENSAKLTDFFDQDKIEVIVHPGGHFVPTLSAYKDIVSSFMESVMKS